MISHNRHDGHAVPVARLVEELQNVPQRTIAGESEHCGAMRFCCAAGMRHDNVPFHKTMERMRLILLGIE